MWMKKGVRGDDCPKEGDRQTDGDGRQRDG